MTERITVRQRLPRRNDFQAMDDVHGYTRLWGNESPTKYRRSTDAKFGGKFDTFDGGGSRSSSDSFGSDRVVGETGRGLERDSDSDSDHQRWTKNPLMVRKVKRSNKSQQAEKRWSGTCSGVAADIKDGFIYRYNEGGVSETHSLGRNTGSNVGGSSSKGSNKYQRLEEMRRKRINLSITSDEESTAQVTKMPLRYGSRIRSVPATNNWTEPARQTEAYKSHFGAETVHKINLQTDLASQSSTLPSGSLKVAPKASNDATPYHPTSVPTVSPLSRARTGFSSQLLTSEYSGKTTAHNVTNQQAPTRNPQPQRTESHEPFYRQLAVTGSRQPDVTRSQPFYKIVDTKSPPSTRTLCNTSPQFTIHKFTTHIPAHSVNSVVNSPLKSNVTDLQNLHHIKPTESPPRIQVSKTATFFRPSPQPNTGIDMTLMAEELPESTQKIPQTGLSNLRRCGHSDDSLDELVESNIRYLDRTNDKFTTKRNSSTNSMRISSLTDPRKISHSGYSSGFSSGQYNQPSVQVRTSTNIQLHVSVPTCAYPTSPAPAATRLQIEPASDRCAFYDQGISPPDVVPRKMTRDICWRSPQMNSEYHDIDSLTQSDNPDHFVNINNVQNNLQPEEVFTRGRIRDGKTRSDTEVSRPARQMERGMFSDVEYDIEVSERVKKWETLLKVRHHKHLGNKDCDTILENLEGESPALPSGNDLRNSDPSLQQLKMGFPYLREVVQASTTAPKELSSEKSIFKSEKWTATNVPSVEKNTSRLLQAVPDRPLNIQSQNVSQVFHPPVSTITNKTWTGDDKPRQQIFSNRVHSIPDTNTSPGTTNKDPLHKGYGYQTQLQTDMSHMTKLSRDEELKAQSQTITPLVTRPSRLTNAQDMTKRGSVYRDELDEISGLKADTVINLRRHFDTGSTTVTSDDDQRSVSTASAKLTRPSKEHKSQNEPVDWSKVLPGYNTLMKDSDLWSPNLESTQGVPVSIERVTARTLQTKTFSEDPFWKEMEEMTSFDPTSSVGHLNAGKTQERTQTVDSGRSHHRVELTPPQSLTLPNKSWNHVIPVTDRIQKSKSLYTPNITPVFVDRKTKSDAVIALDAVLNDINKSSLDRKQQIPGDKLLEAANMSTVSALAHVSRDLQSHINTTQPKITFEVGEVAPRKSGTNSHLQYVKPIISSQFDHVRSEARTSQPIQSCQNPLTQLQLKRQAGKPQISQGILSGYQLDPNLLKQKLLKTGLVVETDPEEPADREQCRRSWPRSSAPGNSLVSSTTTPSCTKTTVKPNYSFPSQESILPTSTQASNLLLGTVNTRPWSGNQAGLRTLDNLQNALSPFRSTSYQPGPESLYGTSRLESFREPNLSTSGEVRTSTTGWANNKQESENTKPTDNTEYALSSSSSRLQEVNESMDDLRNLALDVEQRINVIKNRLQSTNEKSLDSIHSSLRALAPEVKRHEIEPATFEDYYTTKKSKLSDALTELDRIYNNLELNVDDIKSLTDKSDHTVYSRLTSNHPVTSPQPRSVHLRPMQTRISSVFIRDPDSTNTNNTDKVKESQIDVISKSFQAIVDEVNKTTELLSRVAERNRQENMAPETQKQIFKMSAKPANTKMTNSLPSPITDTVLTSNTSSVDARPTQAVDYVDSKFRPKPEGSLGDGITDDKTKPEFVSDRESAIDCTIRKAVQPAAGIDQVSQKTTLGTVKVTASAATKQTSPSSEVTRQQARTRPVQENQIVQEDRAVKQQSSEKTFSVSSPTQPSPTFSRKVTISDGSDVKLLSSQVLSQKQTKETNGAHLPSENELDHVPITLQFAASTPANTECSSSGNSESQHSSSVASTTNTDLAVSTIPTTPVTSMITNPKPSAAENNSRVMPHDSKLDDSESTLNVDPKGKRRVGAGVAMILDRFSSCKDKVNSVKPIARPRSVPDVSEPTTEPADGQDDLQAQTQQTGTRENPDPLLRTCEQSSSNNPPLSTCEKSAVSFLVKKVGDPETKAMAFETCSPQPSSPVNKPAVSPWKTPTFVPEKQTVDDYIQADSPTFGAKEPQTLSSRESTPSDGYLTPNEEGFPQESAGGISPLDTNVQLETANNRPHSFHELISCSEAVVSEIQTDDKFRKCSSTNEVNSDTL